MHQDKILKAEYNITQFCTLCEHSATPYHTNVPVCCDILKKLVKVFVVYRVYFLIRIKNQEKMKKSA